MKVGDIVLLTGARKKSEQLIFLQKIYSFYHNILSVFDLCQYPFLLHGPFSHVAMHIGNGIFIEAYPGKKYGVYLTTLSDIFHPNRTQKGWKIYRHKKIALFEEYVNKHALAHLEKKYALIGDSNTYFCSQLIYDILYNAFEEHEQSDVLLYMPKIHQKCNKLLVYPDHFYTMITNNEEKLWSEVTEEYKFDDFKTKFISKCALNSINRIYKKYLPNIYKDRPSYTKLRREELVNGYMSWNKIIQAEKIKRPLWIRIIKSLTCIWRQDG